VQTALGQVSDIQMGFTARERLVAVESGTPIIQLRDLQFDGRLRADHLTRCELGTVAPRYFVTNGDILFRSRGDKNTATTVVGLDAASVAVLPLVIIRPKAAVVQPHYLSWFINSEWTQEYFDKAAHGTNLRMISRADLEALPIDVPDLRTQTRIVEIEHLATEERRLSLQLMDMRNRLLASKLRTKNANLTSSIRCKMRSSGRRSTRRLIARFLPTVEGDLADPANGAA
jgi:hypothetical protein